MNTTHIKKLAALAQQLYDELPSTNPENDLKKEAQALANHLSYIVAFKGSLQTLAKMTESRKRKRARASRSK